MCAEQSKNNVILALYDHSVQEDIGWNNSVTLAMDSVVYMHKIDINWSPSIAPDTIEAQGRYIHHAVRIDENTVATTAGIFTDTNGWHLAYAFDTTARRILAIPNSEYIAVLHTNSTKAVELVSIVDGHVQQTCGGTGATPTAAAFDSERNLVIVGDDRGNVTVYPLSALLSVDDTTLADGGTPTTDSVATRINNKMKTITAYTPREDNQGFVSDDSECDISQFIGTGPFHLRPGDSTTIRCAIMFAPTSAERNATGSVDDRDSIDDRCPHRFRVE